MSNMGRRWGADIYLDPSIDVGAIPYKGANGKLLWLTPGAADQVIASTGVSPAIPAYADQSGGGGGGGGTRDMLGSASFNPSSGSISGLVTAGVVSGVTRTGTGQYSVAFASAQPDANYQVAVVASDDNVAATLSYLGGTATDYTTTGFKIVCVGGSFSSLRDPQVVRISIFRYGSSVAGGALVLLESHTASASASLDFTTRNATGQSGATFQSDYDEYVIELLNMINATDNQNLYLRMSTNGGSSYDSGANYNWTNWAWRSNASGAFGANATNQIILNPVSSAGNKNTSTYGLCASLRLYRPSSTSLYKQVNGIVSSVDATSFLASSNAGVYLSTTAVNAIQFLMSSGNIATGTIRLYGVAK